MNILPCSQTLYKLSYRKILSICFSYQYFFNWKSCFLGTSHFSIIIHTRDHSLPWNFEYHFHWTQIRYSHSSSVVSFITLRVGVTSCAWLSIHSELNQDVIFEQFVYLSEGSKFMLSLLEWMWNPPVCLSLYSWCPWQNLRYYWAREVTWMHLR